MKSCLTVQKDLLCQLWWDAWVNILSAKLEKAFWIEKQNFGIYLAEYWTFTSLCKSRQCISFHESLSFKYIMDQTVWQLVQSCSVKINNSCFQSFTQIWGGRKFIWFSLIHFWNILQFIRQESLWQTVYQRLW